jgi:hypothetical protein
MQTPLRFYYIVPLRYFFPEYTEQWCGVLLLRFVAIAETLRQSIHLLRLFKRFLLHD